MPILVSAPTPTPAVQPASTYTDEAYAQLPEYVRETDDNTAYDLLYAACSQSDTSYALLVDPSTHLDPLATPSDLIDWVGALAGIDLTSVPQAQWRSFIASTTSRNRGSLAAIRQRVGMTLTGSKSVEIVCPYSGSADRIAVTTYASETPDATATEAAVRAEIPAWMKATIVTNAAGQSYSAMATDYATYGAMATTNKTYGTLSQEI